MMPIGSSSSTIGRLVIPASQATILPRYARATCRRANVLQFLNDPAASLRHVQRRVEPTRWLDRGEPRTLRATGASPPLDLPPLVQRLECLRGEGNDFAVLGSRRQNHMPASRGRPHLQVADQ